MAGRLPRVRTDIDGRSFLEVYPDGQSSTAVLFVHGFLGNTRGTWADTPQTLMTLPVLADADWGSFGYRTSLVYRRDVRQTFDEFILWVRAHARQYKNIFFITHSMGGLLVRELCSVLGTSQDPNDIDLFSSIRRAFLIAPPIGGAVWARRIARVPLAKRLNSHLSFLAEPEKFVAEFPAYENAVTAAKSAGRPYPLFSIFIGTEDGVVQDILHEALISDDVYEGPVVGNHSTLKVDLTVNSTLVKRIVQIISDDLRRRNMSGTGGGKIANAPPSIARDQTATGQSNSEGTRESKPIILISCSAHKRTDREILHPKKGGLPAALEDNALVISAIQTRAQIMGLLQSGRIDGTEYKEGNRAGRPENRALILGPDFGGAINEPKYLPAFWRYSGRTYQASKDEWENFIQFPDKNRPSILILSGLYGLIPFDEYIQNYDCHITDTDTVSGQRILDYWGVTITDTLLSHCDRIEVGGGKVGPIIDLLSERSYQNAIDWTRVRHRCSVLHRVFENKSDRDALVNVGIFLRTLLRQPGRAATLVADAFIDEPDFIDADRIAFEREIGASPLEVARN